MITGLDLVRLHAQGLMWLYLEQFDNDLATINHIADKSVELAETIRTMTDEDVDAYLQNVEFPDIDHNKYWLLGLDNPDHISETE